MSVVTVSREYGTGGRIFAKNLAKELGFTYADKKLARELGEKLGMKVGYVEHFLDTGIPVGMSSTENSVFAYNYEETQKNVTLQIESHKLIRKLAQDQDIVIVGRASDIILKEFNPFRIFVYGDTTAKVNHIRKKEPEGKVLGSDIDIQREMEMIDGERYQHHALFSPIRWGEKLGYDICINSSNVDLDKIVPAVAIYVRAALGING